MGATTRVWVIKDDDAVGDLVPSGAVQSGYDRGPFVVRDRTRLLFALCFLLGPLVLACTRRGAARFLWAGFGVAGVALWLGTLWRWQALERWVEIGRIPFAPWSVGMLLASTFAILAWARALHGIGTDRRFDPEKLPRWIRNPAVAVVLGLVAPGASYMANGAAGRAALAAWNAAFTVLAALLLWKARWLWQANTATPYWPLAPSTLEWGLLAAGAVGFLAALGWLAGVLDGVRCGLDDRRARGALRGDGLTLILLVALAVAYAASEPSTLAWDANETAITLERDGMRRAPLLFARLAQHLDPAHPEYAVHVASLLDINGDADGARGVRAALQVRWRQYQRVFSTPVQSDSSSTARSDSTSVTPVAGNSMSVPMVGSDSTSVTPVGRDSLVTSGKGPSISH